MIRQKENNLVLVLDIGTEAVKGLLLNKKKEETELFCSGLTYFDKYRSFETEKIEQEILEKAISNLLSGFGLKEEKERKEVFLLFGLAPDILKSRILSLSLKRKKIKTIDKSEEKEIFKRVLDKTKKEISREISQELGILPSDFSFLRLKFLEIKIEGYRVPCLRGYEGENLEFRILGIFYLKNGFEKIERVVDNFGFKEKEVFSSVEGLICCLRKEKPDGLFIDVGGEVSQIFFVKKGILKRVKGLRFGGSFFSHILGERLGLTDLDARILKERYANRELSLDSQERIKEIFSQEIWFEEFFDKIKTKIPGILLSRNIFLFGGGALLPEIKEYLRKEDRKAKISVILPGQLNILPKGAKISKNPQYTNNCLIYKAFLNKKMKK